MTGRWVPCSPALTWILWRMTNKLKLPSLVCGCTSHQEYWVQMFLITLKCWSTLTVTEISSREWIQYTLLCINCRYLVSKYFNTFFQFFLTILTTLKPYLSVVMQHLDWWCSIWMQHLDAAFPYYIQSKLHLIKATVLETDEHDLPAIMPLVHILSCSKVI